jgi:hypothetical protein
MTLRWKSTTHSILASLSVKISSIRTTCMYVCMHGCMYVWMYVCMYVCMYGCMYGCMYVCVHVCICVCVVRFMCVSRFVKAWTCAYIDCPCICMYMRAYSLDVQKPCPIQLMQTYVHTYIHTYICTRTPETW